MSKLPSRFTQLPGPVLQTLRAKFMKYEGSPFSFVETSHRSKLYENLNTSTVDAIKQYLGTPDYEVLLMPSASAMASLYYNCIDKDSCMMFYSAGSFSTQPFQEMKRYYPSTERLDSPQALAARLGEIELDRKNIVHYNRIEDGRLVDLPVMP